MMKTQTKTKKARRKSFPGREGETEKDYDAVCEIFCWCWEQEGGREINQCRIQNWWERSWIYWVFDEIWDVGGFPFQLEVEGQPGAGEPPQVGVIPPAAGAPVALTSTTNVQRKNF